MLPGSLTNLNSVESQPSKTRPSFRTKTMDPSIASKKTHSQDRKFLTVTHIHNFLRKNSDFPFLIPDMASAISSNPPQNKEKHASFPSLAFQPAPLPCEQSTVATGSSSLVMLSPRSGFRKSKSNPSRSIFVGISSPRISGT